MLFTLIIVIHELGHLMAAIFYKWNIEKVILLPFGALTVFHEKINRPLKEEFIILIMGPIFQLIGTYFLYFFYNPLVLEYSLVILGFNLLPIFPLDGAKLVNIIFNKITSFNTSHLLGIYISVFTIILLLLKVKFSLLFILIISFISLKVYYEVKNHHDLFNAFLLERYNYHIRFKKNKIIRGENLKKMKRDCMHLFYKNGRYITEREALKKRFDFKRRL